MIVRSGMFIKSLMNIRTKNPLEPSVSEDFYHSHVIYVCS